MLFQRYSMHRVKQHLVRQNALKDMFVISRGHLLPGYDGALGS